MTEGEWLAATDPRPILEFLKGKATDRKLRLFACAVIRSAPVTDDGRTMWELAQTFDWYENRVAV